jgi:localization factor PodJL
MQTDLPWNVAGISPEAREAARAAARREGLSVGEWLTRRIAAGPDAAPEDRSVSGWTFSATEPSGRTGEPELRAAGPEIQDILLRIARSEGESQNAYKVLDQQLKAVARRLETAERTQTENSRAMAQAATQINIATREQAQAFEQMAANVAVLSDRLARVERHGAQEGLKEAIKALHQGLAHVADQIAQTANQSTSQMAVLRGNIDSLTSRLVETREKTDGIAEAIDARLDQIAQTATQSTAQIAVLTGNIDSLTSRLVETREKADGVADAIDARLVSLDERLRVVERTAFSSASALDHTMENVERLRAAQDSAQAEAQLHAAAAGEVHDGLKRLDDRISANESEANGALTRVEEALAQLRSQQADDPVEHRLQGIEHVLADLTSRIEQNERASADASGGVEQTLRELSAGLEAADQRNRQAIEQLQTALHDSEAKIEAIESKTPAAAQLEKPAEPILDMPALPDALPVHDTDDHFSPPPFPFEEPAPDHAEPAFGDSFADLPPPQVEAESYLSTARQAARDADAQSAPRASMGDFAWTFSRKDKTEPARGSAKRYMMAGSIFGVAVAAALTGVVLTRGAGSPPPPRLLHAAIATTAVSASRSGGPATFAAPVPSTAANEAVDDDSVSKSSARLAAPNHKVAATPAQPTGAPVASAKTMVAATDPVNPTMAKTSAGAAAMAAPLAAAGSALQRLTTLANTGDSKGQLLLGLKYLNGSGVAANEAEAARWLARAAQQGEPLAEYRLGTLYERGRGVPADAKQATHWYELAAKQGNRKAMHNVAVAFAEGSGEPKDPAQAALWFTRAANLGLADSQFNLAVLYERGMGVHQSLVDAYKWYLIAAAQGDAESKKRADALATQLSEGDRNAAQQAATAFRSQEPSPAANSVPAFG